MLILMTVYKLLFNLDSSTTISNEIFILYHYIYIHEILENLEKTIHEEPFLKYPSLRWTRYHVEEE